MFFPLSFFFSPYFFYVSNLINFQRSANGSLTLVIVPNVLTIPYSSCMSWTKFQYFIFNEMWTWFEINGIEFACARKSRHEKLQLLSVGYIHLWMTICFLLHHKRWCVQHLRYVERARRLKTAVRWISTIAHAGRT